jgi:adenylyltransferase/sulfurtransferase
MSLTSAEIARYQRHLSLEGFGPEKQELLKKSSVLVIGAGGLGCPALLYLAAAGLGKIVLVDPDRVDVSNLQRQVLFASEDAGRLKVEAAAQRLKALNPLVEVVARPELVTRGNALELVGQVDVVVDGSDNFPTRYLVNDACVIANKPLVYGAIHAFEGQVSVFNYRGGPTYRCLFAEPPDPGTVPNCAEGGVLGVLPGLIGTMQACETVKILTGIGEPLSGRLWLWNALTMTTQTLAFTSDPRSREIRELPPEGYGVTCAVQPSNPEIDAETLRKMMHPAPEKPVQLLDVRETWEREQGAIHPSVHIPLGALEKESAIEPIAGWDRSAPTVVYCASGRRSLKGAALLREKFDFEDAVSLSGGYKGWSAQATA